MKTRKTMKTFFKLNLNPCSQERGSVANGIQGGSMKLEGRLKSAVRNCIARLASPCLALTMALQFLVLVLAPVTAFAQVVHDTTLSGDGSVQAPLGVATPLVLTNGSQQYPTIRVTNDGLYGTAVWGSSGGVFGGTGVFGQSDNGNGVAGSSRTNGGVVGISDAGIGVRGESSGGGLGVKAVSNGSNALWAITGNPSTAAIWAYSAGGLAENLGLWVDGRSFFSGNVGIGTTNPLGKLQVVTANDATPDTVYNWDNRHFVIGAPSSTGGVGISYNQTLNYGIISALSPSVAWRNLVLQEGGGNVGIGTVNPQTKLDVAGTIKATVVQITGADFSEKFDVRSAQTKIEPGMVVAIDPQNPGKLVVSAQAYNRRVAGILSGAGGIKPGMLMGQPGTLADGDQPVALSGRVYVWADASNGPITPGDLLTTSTLPGHAMKVIDYSKAQGATIGKAMTSLQHGKGLVLVLVTLQ